MYTCITFNGKILLIPDTLFLATLIWLNGLNGKLIEIFFPLIKQ